MDLAGIENNRPVDASGDHYYDTPDVGAPPGYATMSGALPLGSAPMNFPRPRDDLHEADPLLKRRGILSPLDLHADADSPFNTAISSDPSLSGPWPIANNEDPNLASTSHPQDVNSGNGELSPRDPAPNDWSTSTAQESPAVATVLQPNRPNAPVLGAPADHRRRLPSEPWSVDDPRQAMRGPSPRESLAVCEQCQFEQSFVSYCPACSFHFCRDHWDGQPLHHGQRLVNGVPHEKTDPLVAKKVKSIIEPSISEEEQAQLHRADDDTTWFGVLPDATDTSQRLFHDFGRYEEFLSQSMFSPKSGQFPSLISFVGPTGAGKSTIVKGLVKLPESSNGEFRQQTLVVG